MASNNSMNTNKTWIYYNYKNTIAKLYDVIGRSRNTKAAKVTTGGKTVAAATAGSTTRYDSERESTLELCPSWIYLALCGGDSSDALASSVLPTPPDSRSPSLYPTTSRVAVDGVSRRRRSIRLSCLSYHFSSSSRAFIYIYVCVCMYI